MAYSSLGRSATATPALEVSTIPAAVFLHRPYVERSDPRPQPARPAAPRQIAVPGPGKQPDFDEILNLASIGVLYHHQVAVLCLTDEVLCWWHRKLAGLTGTASGLDVFDARRPGRVDWIAFFDGAAYDMVILHDASTALRLGRVMPVDIKRLVSAAPVGLIVLV